MNSWVDSKRDQWRSISERTGTQTVLNLLLVVFIPRAFFNNMHPFKFVQKQKFSEACWVKSLPVVKDRLTLGTMPFQYDQHYLGLSQPPNAVLNTCPFGASGSCWELATFWVQAVDASALGLSCCHCRATPVPWQTVSNAERTILHWFEQGPWLVLFLLGAAPCWQGTASGPRVSPIPDGTNRVAQSDFIRLYST